MNNRENRMEILHANGVDTSKYFTVKIPEGIKAGSTMTICFNKNGEPVVNNNDAIVNEIIADGYVRNTKLHRRFVMAQMFKALNYKNRWTGDCGFAGYVRDKGYKYSINMMIEEVRVLSKLKERDEETFNERSSFFTKDVVVEVLNHYMENLKKYIDGLKTYNCKGVPYKKIKSKDIFVDDLDNKIYSPMKKIINYINILRWTPDWNGYEAIYKELLKFKKIMIHLPHKTEISPVFMDTYKGEGAYYTLKNMVMYHSCKLAVEKDGRPTGEYVSGMSAVEYLNNCNKLYSGEGWKMMGLLRKTIEINNFNWKDRLAEIYS
jgi:hypothetical protein